MVDARPTMTMIACMRRLNAIDGVMKPTHHGARGFVVRPSNAATPVYWFPTTCGNGLIARGFVSEREGGLTRTGRRWLEANAGAVS